MSRLINQTPHYVLGIFIMAVYTSCAPRISKQIIRTMPPQPANTSVQVFQYGEQPPRNTEVIALLKAVDGGSSKGGDSITVMDRLIETTREVGGNGLWINEHQPPSFWKGSSHQFAASALWMENKTSPSAGTARPDSVSFLTVGSVEALNQSNRAEVSRTVNAIPRVVFSFDGGYGGLPARTKGLSGAIKEFENSLSNGASWGVAFHHYPRNFHGWGVVYHGYGKQAGSQSLDIRTLYNNTFIGGVYSARTPLRNKRWMIAFDIGLGYLGSVWNNRNWNKTTASRNTASSVGLYLAIDGEYRLSKVFGIGVKINWISGSYSSLNVNGVKQTLEKGQYIGASVLSGQAGLRVYINR